MSAVADTTFDEVLTRVSDLLEKLKGAWDDIVNGVNHVLSFLPGFLEGPIKSVFETCASKVTEVFTEMTKLFSDRGAPDALRAAGESWNEDVGHRASTQAGLLAKEALEGTKEWAGDAADRYADVITAQGRALTQIKTITDNLQTTLNEIASDLKFYWLAIAAAFSGYVGYMIFCILGACGVMTTIPSLLEVFMFSSSFLGAVTTLSANFTNKLDDNKAKIEQQSTMDAQFANGNWPSAVTEKMSDASVRDGDKSDWTPK